MTQPKWYDGTFFYSEGWTMKEIIDIATPLCDRFVVGDEIGEGGTPHLQCRFVFKTEKTIQTLRNQFGAKKGHEVHFTPTHVRDFNYCEKEGRFYRSWEGPISKFVDLALRPWQEDFIKKFKATDDRTVLVVYDPYGNNGKTWLSKFMQATRQAQYVPPLSEAQDLMAFALEKQAHGYVFDMPRSDTIKQKKGMWSAVEQIKNGYLYDKRYKYRDTWTEPPKVAVFCNDLPEPNLLSFDRWQVYKLGGILGVRCLQRMEPTETKEGWEWSIVAE